MEDYGSVNPNLKVVYVKPLCICKSTIGGDIVNRNINYKLITGFLKLQSKNRNLTLKIFLSLKKKTKNLSRTVYYRRVTYKNLFVHLFGHTTSKKKLYLSILQINYYQNVIRRTERN